MAAALTSAVAWHGTGTPWVLVGLDRWTGPDPARHALASQLVLGGLGLGSLLLAFWRR